MLLRLYYLRQQKLYQLINRKIITTIISPIYDSRNYISLLASLGLLQGRPEIYDSRNYISLLAVLKQKVFGNLSTIVEIILAYQPGKKYTISCWDLRQQKLYQLISLSISPSNNISDLRQQKLYQLISLIHKHVRK